MKLSIGLINVLLTGALAHAVKRQEAVPFCAEGDPGNISQGPYASVQDCLDVCYMRETVGDRFGQICRGHCDGIAIIGGFTSWLCDTNDQFV
ncbi:hypothetical protein BDW02DRAFT_588863 [Decorospora gaudefroyi]|uniref:WSC domain-containing protein n=1 Tax=Decorospora gaudefroyi TaxID=184978 RepID=A0A6A5KFV4_9PLEO|nr:hypothetical protein BDW02DRAFT_588863 [Decorospora gaudefroyi]